VGKANIVYIDESGFIGPAFNPYAWAPRGQRVWGDRPGNMKASRTNLIMAQRGKEWLAPVLFTGSCDAAVVEAWLTQHLFAELTTPSVIVLDNAPFHRKSIIKTLAQKHGHEVLFLPPYSPDFNPIEQSFGLLKRKRLYHPNLSLEQLIAGKC
jgi:putative transposase